MTVWDYVYMQDEDKDSKLSLDDYRAAITKERLLIEAFGPCLPPRHKVDEFCDSIFNSSTTRLP